MGKLIVFGAAYDDVGVAMRDYQQMQKLYADGHIGSYDAAMATKEPNGYVVLANGDSAGRFKGGAAGALVGGVLGVVFPPSAIVMAGLGAGAGAMIGSTKEHLGKGDFKEIADVLSPGESGILLVTESVDETADRDLFPQAKRSKAIEIEGDAEALKAAILKTAEASKAERTTAAEE
jgi:uncharacterized membrane protein